MTRKSRARASGVPSASRTFWSTFVRNHWEKTPVAYKAGSAAAYSSITAINASEIFALLVKYSDLCRKRETLDGLKFYVDGVRLESFEAIENLPVASDKSLEGYHKRMSFEFSDYGLVCDELLQVLEVKDPNRKAIGEFMQGLQEFTGVPNRFAELGLYLGNYRKTPFGVHIDPCGVFSFPVVGKKTFRLWDPKFVEKKPELKEAFSYDEFKKKSVILEAAQGDLTYWPSTYWHIAESDGAFSCTWSIGIWVDRPLSDIVVEALTPLITKSIGRAGKQTSLKKPPARQKRKASAASSASALPGAPSSAGAPSRTPELPPELKAAAKTISKLSTAQIEKVLAKWWRDHSTHQGFKR